MKQVAALDEDFEIRADGRDVEADFLIRDLNEWDDFSLEEAVKIKEASAEPVEVIAVSVGPEEVDESLRKCLAKGADRAIRVWDAAVEGSDPIAIARVLAAVAKREAPSMLFAGVQSSDQAFASTGIATAAFLGWPHAAVVSSLGYAPGAKSAVFRRELEGGLLHEVEIQCPAVLTIQLGINTPRYASLRSIKQAAAKPIEVRSLADLGLDRRRRRRGGLAVAGAPHVCARKGPRATDRGRCRRAGQAPGRDHSRIQGRSGVSGVLIVAEQRRGELRPRSLELISAAQGLRRPGEEVAVALLAAAPARVSSTSPEARRSRRNHRDQGAGGRIRPRHLRGRARRLDRRTSSRCRARARTASIRSVTPPRLPRSSGSDSRPTSSKRERIEGELVATRGGYGQKVNVEVDFPGRSTVLLALRGNVFKPPDSPPHRRKVSAFAAPPAPSRSVGARIHRTAARATMST